MSIAPIAATSPSSLMHPMAPPAASRTEASASVITGQPDTGDSLESRFIRAAADLSAKFEADRAHIADDVNRIDPTDLVAMNAMQVRLAQYSLDVSMALRAMLGRGVGTGGFDAAVVTSGGADAAVATFGSDALRGIGVGRPAVAAIATGIDPGERRGAATGTVTPAARRAASTLLHNASRFIFGGSGGALSGPRASSAKISGNRPQSTLFGMGEVSTLLARDRAIGVVGFGVANVGALAERGRCAVDDLRACRGGAA
ncbi:hypothetical protein PIN31115_00469 [Pandoraea iniqua]|uniref:Uncharacterized protein n=1 Tax=Pandoraea iniqua TaxID=2508288 RepID=A0A5E4S2V1_9BURK|nr:hypothetical protein [Pandoraea iniqua]VVD68418.1 hypothetical protein PIN31115_00469 [Pandoraea iniqua]